MNMETVIILAPTTLMGLAKRHKDSNQATYFICIYFSHEYQSSTCNKRFTLVILVNGELNYNEENLYFT